MKIKYHKKFEKRFKKLSPSLKDKTASAIGKFVEDPFNYVLVIMLDVGTHPQVYGD